MKATKKNLDKLHQAVSMLIDATEILDELDAMGDADLLNVYANASTAADEGQQLLERME